MTCISKLGDVLPEGYGFVVGAGVGALVLNMYLAYNVMRARKAYDVKYPALYSDTSNEFNCIQRAHQSYLENLPVFLYTLSLSGLQYPRISAGCGVVYLLGRVLHAQGYMTGDPAKRTRGSVASLALIVLMGGVASLAFHLNRHHHVGIFRYFHHDH